MSLNQKKPHANREDHCTLAIDMLGSRPLVMLQASGQIGSKQTIHALLYLQLSHVRIGKDMDDVGVCGKPSSGQVSCRLDELGPGPGAMPLMRQPQASQLQGDSNAKATTQRCLRPACMTCPLHTRLGPPPTMLHCQQCFNGQHREKLDLHSAFTSDERQSRPSNSRSNFIMVARGS